MRKVGATSDRTEGPQRGRAGRREADATLQRFREIVYRVVGKENDRSSLVTEIACVVGAEILEGIRAPGSDLNSVELARRFKTSRTPAREAVILLEKEGLVEILPRRRPRVAEPSLQEVREIYTVRAAILSLLCETVCSTATNESIAELKAIVGEMRKAALAGDRNAFFWSNVSFHEHFAVISGNRTLQTILLSLTLRGLRLRRMTLSQQSRVERSLTDHTHLVDALANRESELASALIKANVLSALKVLEHVLSGQEQA